MTETLYNLIAEYFSRPQIPKESDVVNQILKSNYLFRMRSYNEAGCRHHYHNFSNINQHELYSFVSEQPLLFLHANS
jgi:hypothetical protein